MSSPSAWSPGNPSIRDPLHHFRLETLVLFLGRESVPELCGPELLHVLLTLRRSQWNGGKVGIMDRNHINIDIFLHLLLIRVPLFILHILVSILLSHGLVDRFLRSERLRFLFLIGLSILGSGRPGLLSGSFHCGTMLSFVSMLHAVMALEVFVWALSPQVATFSASITDHRGRSPGWGRSRARTPIISGGSSVLGGRSGHPCLIPRWRRRRSSHFFSSCLTNRPPVPRGGGVRARVKRVPPSSSSSVGSGRCWPRSLSGLLLGTVLSRGSPNAGLRILHVFLLTHPITHCQMVSTQLSRDRFIEQEVPTSVWKSLKESVRGTGHIRGRQSWCLTGLSHETQQPVSVFRGGLVSLLPPDTRGLPLGSETIRGSKDF